MSIRPNLDHGDIVYDWAFNESFHKNLESSQYNAAIAITGAIRGTSSKKLFQELDLESLQLRRWLRKLCLFYKLFPKKSPSYLFQLIPPNNKVYATRSSQSNKILSFKTRHKFFRDSIFPAVIFEWNSLDINIRNSCSINVFKKELLKFIRPEPTSTYNINDTKGLRLLTRLRLGLSHLGDHKFRHNFQDCVSPMCYCGQDIETTTHFLLYCPNHHWARKALLHKIDQVSGTISRQSDSITKILLFGDNKLDFETNKTLLMFTIEFISLTESFSCPLFGENLMIQQYHFTHILMKHLCFRLVTFSLHVKPDLLILVSGYSEFCKFILKRFLFNSFYLNDFLLLVNVRVCNVFLRLIINIKKHYIHLSKRLLILFLISF